MAEQTSDSLWKNRIKKDVLLRDYTTFRIGGPAESLIEVDDGATLAHIVSDLATEKRPWKLIGGGSNLLISDRGLNETIIVFRQSPNAIKIKNDRLTVGGGVDLNAAVLASASRNLTGIEFAAGIPGTVGGAIAGNAGAFGESVGDRLETAVILDRHGKMREVRAKELEFVYRNSLLKQTGEIVLEATFFLKPGVADRIESRIEEIMEIRRRRHPDWHHVPCAGSVFRNLEPTSKADRRQAAGAILDEAGAKSFSEGAARVYPKHANIIINVGSASCTDVMSLIAKMKKAVKDKFDVSLEMEIEHWPS